MKELFETIRQICASIPGVKWVDKDYGQIDNYDIKASVSFPCILIKIAISGCETISRKTQLCTGTVTIRVALDLATKETSAAAPLQASDRSLGYYDIANAAYIALQDTRQGPINHFDRVNQVDEDRKDGMSVVKMVFNCGLLDTSAAID